MSFLALQPHILRSILFRDAQNPAQTAEPSTTPAQARAPSSTPDDGPPSTKPSLPAAAAQPPVPSRETHSATKKRRREPASDTVGPAATSEHVQATAAPAERDVTDGAPARKKKKKKKEGVAQK
ncbi:hypothetical protein OG21DRAFT_1489881 [Imleria badia]|nr:hypothetical protein OG21DRAFT_1489881 [Imleria badia]